MRYCGKELIEAALAGPFIGPYAKKDQDMLDLLNAFTLLDDNGLISPDVWEYDDRFPEEAP